MLEQRKLNEAAAPQSLHDQNGIIRNKEHDDAASYSGVRSVYSQNEIDFMKRDNLRAAHSRLNAKILRNASSLNVSIDTNHGSNMRKTNEWADSILKDLDNLILSNQRYVDSVNQSMGLNVSNGETTITPTTATGPPKLPQKRSTIINVVLRKTTPSPSPTSPTAPTAFESAPTNLNKNQTAIITAAPPAPPDAAAAAKDNNKIPKPEKHVSSFDFLLIFFSLYLHNSCTYIHLLNKYVVYDLVFFRVSLSPFCHVYV